MMVTDDDGDDNRNDDRDDDRDDDGDDGDDDGSCNCKSTCQTKKNRYGIHCMLSPQLNFKLMLFAALVHISPEEDSDKLSRSVDSTNRPSI